MRGMEELEQLRASAAAGWARARELDAEVHRLARHAERLDADLQVHVKLLADATYHADSLAVWNKVAPFMEDVRFLDAYRAGMDSGHHILRPPGSAEDIHIEWRVHVLVWAASHAAQLDGDFVECGVNTGIYSLAVCRYLDFNRLDRDFWLFDTFAGIPLELADESERELATRSNARHYEECYDVAVRNFALWPRAHLVRGAVPGTLATVEIGRVAYLSIDMNIAAPERAALEHFWPRMVPGGIIVLDDYGGANRPLQRASADAFAAGVGVPVLALPTGQGILLKPPRHPAIP